MLAEWLEKVCDKAERLIRGRPIETTVSAAAKALVEEAGQRVNLDSPTQRRIARCLKKCGWDRSRKTMGKWFWARKGGGDA